MGDLTARPLIARAGTLIGNIGPTPNQVAFQLANSAVARLVNGAEVQFRFTARMADGSYYSNRDDSYVSLISMQLSTCAQWRWLLRSSRLRRHCFE